MGQDEKTIADALRRLTAGKESIIDMARTVGEGGKQNLSFTLTEKKVNPPAPEREETPRRAHVFHTAESLGDYLKTYGTKNTVVVGDMAEQVVCAVLDETAKGGFEHLRFEPVVHPQFKPWADLIKGGAVSIELFADFVTVNRRIITTPPGRELALLFSQIRVSHSITVHKGRGVNALNGIMCETKIEGQEQKDLVQLPESLTITVPVYVGTPPIDIDLDLTITGEKEAVTVRVSAADLVAARLEAFSIMFDTLRAVQAADKQFTIGLGRLATVGWAYLR